MDSTNIIKFVKTDPRAVVPTKATQNATGYDLTAIKVYKKISDCITLYDTGIAVQPPKGFYTEIVPRSSISKTGYLLANSIGTIDNDYCGSLLIALIKVDQSLPDLEVPFKKCQLTLQRLLPSKMVEVKSLDNTERGSGGFGSTDLPTHFDCSTDGMLINKF